MDENRTPWTPGPWKRNKYGSIGAGEFGTTPIVAHIEEEFGDSALEKQLWANAYLIAAAPDLYSALEIAHTYARQCGWHLATAALEDSIEKEFAEKLVAAVDRMSAALAAARNEGGE